MTIRRGTLYFSLLFLLLVVPFLWTAELRAQNVNKSTVQFTGIVQYTDGVTVRFEARDTQVPVAFQTPIYERESLAVARGGVLKILTKSECVVVLHGPARLLAPRAGEPWRVRAEALRWICPDSARDTLQIATARVEIQSGEILVDGGRMIANRGEIKINGGEPLTNRQLYLLTSKGAEPLKPQPPPLEVWKFNQARRAPQESTPFPRPADEPFRPNTRVILSPIGGGGNTWWDAQALNKERLSTSGARLQLQRRLRNGSLIFALSFREMQDESDKSRAGYSPTGIREQIDFTSLEGGYRFHHERSWSPYFRAGLHAAKPKVFINLPYSSGNYFSGNEYEFYLIGAAFGVDARWAPSFLPWLGLYAAAEANLLQSVTRGGRFNRNTAVSPASPDNEISREPWSLTILTGEIMLGLMTQF